MLANATRICQANFGTMYLYENGAFCAAAMHNVPPAFAEARRRQPVVHPSPDNPMARVAATKQAVQCADFPENPDWPRHEPQFAQFAKLTGARSIIVVPMLKEDELVGVISVYRTEIRLFTDKQTELLTNFAAQAVIAIENTRLFNELRQRTDDLTESLEQQTASGEILASISGSMADTKPVFEAIVRNLKRLFGTRLSMVQILDEDDMVHLAATGQEEEYDVISKSFPRPLDDATGAGRAMLAKKVVQFAPIVGNPDAPPSMQAFAKQLGFNATIFAPMLRDGKVIGAIGVAREEAKPFTEKQVDLIRTFAAQAVIAVENTRLFNELRESLERQTATSEVLGVISSSPGELDPVFEAMLGNATRLCNAKFGTLYLCEGDAFRLTAMHNAPPAFAEERLRNPVIYPLPDNMLGRVVRAKRAVQTEDATKEPLYLARNPLFVAAVELGGFRSFVSVPMLKDDRLVGAINVYRQEVKPFADKQIALLENFAAQAVIAIENARLLSELRESLDRQTATADVLAVMSQSKFDLVPILQSVVDTAARLCRADQAVIFRLEDGLYRFAAGFSLVPEYLEIERANPIEPGPGTAVGRAAMSRAVVRIEDVMGDAGYAVKQQAAVAHLHSIIGVPLLRDGEPIGVIALARCRVEPFNDREVELVTTFADQAVIAIENVRLFDEIQEKSRQLEEASKHKSQFLANMSHELRTPLNAILGYTELIVDGVYGETPEKVLNALQRITTNGKHLLGLINDVLDLSKIEAGQLTLSLADYSMKDVVHSVYSAVEPLAAEKKLSFKAEIAPDMPAGHGDERRLTQVLLNLVGNAIKFTDEGEVKIKAAANDGHFSVAVVDTGPGISEDDQKKLFQEFQQADSSTTKKKGGTGLGLAISKKIVEMHGGTVRLDSKPGEGSTFSFTVPLRAEQAKKQV